MTTDHITADLLRSLDACDDHVAAFAAYHEATATAWATYNEATAPAEAAYHEATATAFLTAWMQE